MGSCFCDVPQPEGALRRLTTASMPGLVAALRIVSLGDNVAPGEMSQRVLSASLTPRKVFGGGDASRKLASMASRRTHAVWGLLIAIPSSLVALSAKDSVLFIGARSSPRHKRLPREWQRVCIFRRLRASNPLQSLFARSNEIFIFLVWFCFLLDY